MLNGSAQNLEVRRACSCQSSNALMRLLSIEALQALASATQSAGCLKFCQKHYFLQYAVWKVEQARGAVMFVRMKSRMPAGIYHLHFSL